MFNVSPSHRYAPVSARQDVEMQAAPGISRSALDDRYTAVSNTLSALTSRDACLTAGKVTLAATAAVIPAVAVGYAGGWLSGMVNVLAVYGAGGWTKTSPSQMTPEAWSLLTNTMRWSIRATAPYAMVVAGAAQVASTRTTGGMLRTMSAVAGGWGAAIAGGLAGVGLGAVAGPVINFVGDTHAASVPVSVGCALVGALGCGAAAAYGITTMDVEEFLP